MAIAGIAIGIAALGVGAMTAYASISSAKETAQAQKHAADANAKATVSAAKEAADAQKVAAQESARAQMHDADTAKEQDEMYLKQEMELTKLDARKEDYYERAKQDIDDIDAIDLVYSEEKSWGSSQGEGNWDYGYDSGATGDSREPYSGSYA